MIPVVLITASIIIVASGNFKINTGEIQSPP